MFKNIMIFVALSFFVVACSTAPATQAPSNFGKAAPNRIDPSQGNNSTAPNQSQLQVILVPSELIVGQNRFAVGLIDPKKGMIHNATVHFRYFDLSNPSQPKIESESGAMQESDPDGGSTIFAQEREFKRAGQWGVEVQARMPDGTSVVRAIAFQVVASSPTIKPGAKVPALKTRTASDVSGDLKKLSSAEQPNSAFYQMTLARATTNGKPTVLVFATPAFCQTRLCGPAYDIADALQKKYGDAVNFIHVEVYTGLPNPAANNWQLDPAMVAFGLQTEPWCFLIDKTGTLVYRVEGLFTEDEVERHLKPLVGS